MITRSRELIHLMLKIQEKLSLMYKNVSVIDGQYNVKLKSTAKILSELMRKRTDFYREILNEAADESDEATEEGYSVIKAAITEIKEDLSQQNFTSVYDFLRYAIDYTEKLLGIIKLVKERIEGTSLNQEALYNTLTQIEHMEEETVYALTAFAKERELA